MTIGPLDDEQLQEHAQRDAGIGEIEGGPAERQLDEVGDRARAKPIEDVADDEMVGPDLAEEDLVVAGADDEEEEDLDDEE